MRPTRCQLLYPAIDGGTLRVPIVGPLSKEQLVSKTLWGRRRSRLTAPIARPWNGSLITVLFAATGATRKFVHFTFRSCLRIATAHYPQGRRLASL